MPVPAIRVLAVSHRTESAECINRTSHHDARALRSHVVACGVKLGVNSAQISCTPSWLRQGAIRFDQRGWAGSAGFRCLLGGVCSDAIG